MRISLLPSTLALLSAVGAATAADAADNNEIPANRMLSIASKHSGIISPRTLMTKFGLDRHLQFGSNEMIPSEQWDPICAMMVGMIEDAAAQDTSMGTADCSCGDRSFSCEMSDVCDPFTSECYTVDLLMDMLQGQFNMCVEETAAATRRRRKLAVGNKFCIDMTMNMETFMPEDCDIRFGDESKMESCADCSFEGICMNIDCAELFDDPLAKGNSCEGADDFAAGFENFLGGGGGAAGGGGEPGDGGGDEMSSTSLLQTARLMELADNGDAADSDSDGPTADIPTTLSSNSGGNINSSARNLMATASLVVLAFVAI